MLRTTAVLSVVLLAVSCGSGSSYRRTDFNKVTVSYSPTAVAIGSMLNVAASGLGTEDIGVYLLPTSDIYNLGDRYKRGELAVLGRAKADTQGKFEQSYVVAATLPANGDGHSLPITPGNWTLALGRRNGSERSESTFGQLMLLEAQ